MRLVTVHGAVVELNYMWLPTFIGQNAEFKRGMEQTLKSSIEGLELTEHNLDKIETMVLNYIVTKHPHIEGLGDYLDGLKFVALTETPSDRA